jgi:hypothetical protein
MSQTVCRQRRIASVKHGNRFDQSADIAGNRQCKRKYSFHHVVVDVRGRAVLVPEVIRQLPWVSVQSGIVIEHVVNTSGDTF